MNRRYEVHTGTVDTFEALEDFLNGFPTPSTTVVSVQTERYQPGMFEAWQVKYVVIVKIEL